MSTIDFHFYAVLLFNFKKNNIQVSLLTYAISIGIDTASNELSN